MDTVAMEPNEMADFSGEQTIVAPSSRDFTHKSNSEFIEESSATLEKCDGRDSLNYIEDSNHSAELQDPMPEKLAIVGASFGGPLLLSDIEKFLAEDSRRMENVGEQFRSPFPMPGDHGVAALFMPPTTAVDDDQSLYSPVETNSSLTALTPHKPVPITGLNKLNVEQSKTKYLMRECVSSLDENFASRENLNIWLPRKNISNCCGEDDDDSCSNNSGSNLISESRGNSVENDRTDKEPREHHKSRRRGRVASESLSTAVRTSFDFQDKDDKEDSRVSEPRRRSRRVERRKVQKVAGEFVVRLRDSREGVDPPKRPTLPKGMTTRVAKLSRRPITVKGTPLTFPDVTFHEGDDQDDEVSYHKRLDLVALKDLVPDVRLAPSTVGKLLKRYSQKADSYFVDIHTISNYKTDLTSYPLVYGAVPRAYSLAAKYFINKCVHLLNVVKRKAASARSQPTVPEISGKEPSHKKRTTHEVVTLHDGEIEIITHCYWQLTTQDLVKWHDDLPRRRVKQIFEYAWVSMRDGVSEACKRDGARKCNLNRVKNALEFIRNYAEFDKPGRLTAACLFMIKEHYDVIIHACRELNLDPLLWESVLRLCGVHHYLCSHTLAEITRRMPQVSKILKYRLLEIEAQTSDCVVQPMSCKAVFKMFSRWITRPSHVTAKLQQAANNLFFAECRGFGLHLVRFGIWRSDVIYAEHVAGYADIRKSAMLVLPLPPLSNVNVKRAINLVYDTVNSAVANCGGKMHKLKISIGAVKELEKYLLYRFSSAIIGATLCRPHTTTSREWVDLFVEAIRDSIDATSTDVHHVDDWSLTDDCDLDEYDDYGVFKKSFAEQYREHFGDSESDSDYDTACEESLQDEIRELRREYPDLVGCTRTQSVPIARGDNKTASKRPKLVGTNTPYQFSEEKISRVKCVLCFAMTTVQTVILETGMRVACCVACHLALNTDPTVNIDLLKRRVRENIKAPIGFMADAGIRTFRDFVDETVKTRLSYNRDPVHQIEPKLTSPEECTASSKSTKRRRIEHHVDAVTQRIGKT